MKVWIVSKIHIGRNDCWVHGLTETKQNIRLLKSDGSCPSINTKFEIGQIWDLDFQKPSQFTLLYGENVIVHSWKYIGYERNLRDFLMERINPWYGGPIQLFGGYLCSGSSWKGLYVAMRKDLPSVSMGYWLPTSPIVKIETKRNTYENHGHHIDYQGFSEAIQIIPEGTLVHVSLKPWWQPYVFDGAGTRSYLQISDWYL